MDICPAQPQREPPFEVEDPPLRPRASSTPAHFLLPGCIKLGGPPAGVPIHTKVLKARFLGQQASGGKIEVLVERLTGERTALAQVRASRFPAPGMTLRLADAFDVTVGERVEPSTRRTSREDCLTLIEQYGRLPLPPYIEHDPDTTDETRYQTVFAHIRARSPRRPPACISTMRFSRDWTNAASSVPR